MPADRPGHVLAALGLSPAQETAYELLVDHPAATVPELRARWPHAEPVDDVLAALVTAGIARATADPRPRYTAVAPRAAFGARLAENWRQLNNAREYADQLTRDYPAHPRGTDVVEVVTGPGAVHERLLQAVRSARHELRRLARPPHPDPAITAAAGESLARGVTGRTLCPEPPDPQLVSAGHQVRVAETETVPVTLYLIDDRLAVLPVDPARYGTVAALVVHPSELLKALAMLFEALWERAGTPPPGHAEPDRLVGLLLSGLTDDAIGRALGVSQRTAQRRVGAMMAAAGARTRFQAGVQAALRQSRGQ